MYNVYIACIYVRQIVKTQNIVHLIIPNCKTDTRNLKLNSQCSRNDAIDRVAIERIDQLLV